jgi:hypothetical protein
MIFVMFHAALPMPILQRIVSSDILCPLRTPPTDSALKTVSLPLDSILLEHVILFYSIIVD